MPDAVCGSSDPRVLGRGSDEDNSSAKAPVRPGATLYCISVYGIRAAVLCPEVELARRTMLCRASRPGGFLALLKADDPIPAPPPGRSPILDRQGGGPPCPCDHGRRSPRVTTERRNR